MIRTSPPQCENCPLAGSVLVPASGPSQASLMIVSESPTDADILRGKLLSGSSGKLLLSLLSQTGIDPSECYVTSASQCSPFDKVLPAKSWQSCWPRLRDEILQVRPTKILALGAGALAALTQSEESSSIFKNRGIGQTVIIEGTDELAPLSVFVVPTLNPLSVIKSDTLFRDLAEDVAKWSRQSEPLPFPDIDLKVPTSIPEVLTRLEGLWSQRVVGVDLETTGTNPVTDEIVSIGFAYRTPGHPHQGSALILRRQEFENPRVKALVRQFLEEAETEKAFHNIKFDLQFLEMFYGERFDGEAIYPVRLRISNLMDTMLMHYALDERTGNLVPGHSLKSLARRYDIPNYKFSFDDFWKPIKALAVEREWDRPLWELEDESIDWEGFYRYHALDCFLTASLADDLREEMADDSVDLFDLVFDILVPGAVAMSEIELRGVKIDREYLIEKIDEISVEIDQVSLELREYARSVGLHRDPIDFDPHLLESITRLSEVGGDSLWEVWGLLRVYSIMAPVSPEVSLYEKRRKRYFNQLMKAAEASKLYDPGLIFNPGSSAHIKPLLSSLGLDPEMSDKDSLQLSLERSAASDEVRAVVDNIQKYRQLTKVRSTYLQGLLEKTDIDGRVRPDYLLFGTATGRLSCQEPNLQNIPAVMGPLVKNAFIPTSPDWVIVDADYSQLELRVAALLSQDQELIQAYIRNEDIHIKVAAAMFRKPPEQITKFERYLAKYVDFGVIYGRGASSLVEGWEMEYYVKMGGSRWTLREAEKFLETFLNGFPGLKAWIEHQHEIVTTQHYVETIMGRRRRFPYITRQSVGSIQRQSVNTPIQSLASDLTFTALTRLHEVLDSRRAHILFTVHDSIVLEIQRDYLDEAIELIKYQMEQNLPITSNVPLRADAEVGDRWGEVVKYEKK